MAEPESALVRALAGVREAVAQMPYPLPVPGAGRASEAAATLVAQIDDYLIPRVRRLDAPLLAVVGGSTGAGKSTLVNSLIRAPVSPAGVLRPTTRTPLLASHPADVAWFAAQDLLPGLTRASRPGQRVLQIVTAPGLTPGLALLDAPDIDSVVDANRALAGELLAAGDLWLFVTTAARYADAVPWRVLRDARERGTAVAVVLDRVPPEARDEITGHLIRMLGGQGLADAPLFVLAETRLDDYGLLPELDVLPIKRWIDGVARDVGLREATARRTLVGAVAGVSRRVDALARAADAQLRAGSNLIQTARDAFGAAMSEIESGMRAGIVLRGEVYHSWRELIDGGELRRALRVMMAQRRRQVHVSLADSPPPGVKFQTAVAVALANLISEADAAAAQRCRRAWRARPEGRFLIANDTRLGRPWTGFVDAAHEVVHDWQRWLRAIARAEAPQVRTQNRSYGTAATVLLATIAAVAPPADDLSARADGDDLLRAVLDDREVGTLAERARWELFGRVNLLFNAEINRHVAAVAAAGLDDAAGHRLREASARLEAAQSSGSIVGRAA